MDNSYQHSTIAQIIENILEQFTFEGESKSNIADILLSILNKTEYNEEPRSVIGDLLIRLKAKIEGESYDPYDAAYTSRIAEILISILEDTEYTEEPQSRIAELLLELKEALGDYTELTASGSVASFITNCVKPLVNGEFTIAAYQEGTGDPSPVNVRNIVPFNKLRINMVNFNQIANYNIGGNGHNGIKIINVVDGVCEISGTTTATYAALFTSQNIKLNDKYLIMSRSVYNPDNLPLRFAALNTSGIACELDDAIIEYGRQNVRSTIGFSGMTNGADYTGVKVSVMFFNLTEMFGARIADYLYNLEKAQKGAGVAIFKQLFYKDYYDYNVGGTWVSVASVNGDSYPDYAEIALGEDVYGSVYNSGSGKNRVTHNKLIYDNSAGWSMAGDILSRAIPREVAFVNNIPMCNFLKGISRGGSSGLGIWQVRLNNVMSTLLVKVDLNLIPDLTAWGNYLANNPLEVVLELNDDYKREEQLDPTLIKTHDGSNNIFCDTGDTSVTYLYKGTPPATLNRVLSKSPDVEDIIKEEELEDLKDLDELQDLDISDKEVK
jgi:hypothetical protein